MRAEFAQRQGIRPSVRRAVIARDGMVCFHCGCPVVFGGKTYRPDKLHLDHLLPWAAGGADDVDNLVVSCARCNLVKGNPEPVVRQRIVRLEYRHGSYRWPDDYTPPRILRDDEVGFPLATLIERGDPRRSLVALLRGIHRGELSATASGKVYVGLPPIPEQRNRRRGRRRLS